ncbi:flavodoxin family protein [Thermodesulfobacteriota bacterium]
MNQAKNGKKILLLYYSFSGQTGSLIRKLAAGLREKGLQLEKEKLVPVPSLRFPVGSVGATIGMMLSTFIRRRVGIKELSPVCFKEYDLVILAGPTWSYNPSGPVMSLFDRDGRRVFNGKTVLPMISCRGYWRTHWWGLKALLHKCNARVVNCIVFSHPTPEPWRTLGVFLKIAGRHPERSAFFSRFYKHFGHSPGQSEEARRFGNLIGEALINDTPLTELDFRTRTARP